MSNGSLYNKHVNLADFDFSVDRSRLATPTDEPHDGCVTVRMPGKNRKTANHELHFIPYLKKNRLKFKTVAIGKGLKKKQAPIVAFDQDKLLIESATIRKYGKALGVINSKGHALKLLDIFSIQLSDKADEVVKLYFKLHPIPINQTRLNYHICTISLMKVITNGDKPCPPAKTKRLKKLPKINKPPTPSHQIIL